MDEKIPTAAEAMARARAALGDFPDLSPEWEWDGGPIATNQRESVDQAVEDLAKSMAEADGCVWSGHAPLEGKIVGRDTPIELDEEDRRKYLLRARERVQTEGEQRSS